MRCSVWAMSSIPRVIRPSEENRYHTIKTLGTTRAMNRKPDSIPPMLRIVAPYVRSKCRNQKGGAREVVVGAFHRGLSAEDVIRAYHLKPNVSLRRTITIRVVFHPQLRENTT